jgi:hypothetical protein
MLAFAAELDRRPNRVGTAKSAKRAIRAYSLTGKTDVILVKSG